ncbi:hypothetical protein VXS06_16470 [Photobacterium toruni]|uniref:Uncharacterized protein n=1 Tax=Photobacterium toruni TaxID=1935446 RepID=A0ABU6L9V0_9GAMM|nr:hypothetical protein [Photobacterium toruni]
MASNCKEFNYLIDRKQVYTSNDIPSLIAYNKCLTSEIDSLSSKVDKLDDANSDYKERLSNLGIKIASIKDLQEEKLQTFYSTYNEKLAKLETVQEQNLNSYNSMFETSKSMYSDTLTGLGIIITLAGILGIVTLTFYKLREIQELTDKTLENVQEKLSKEGYIQRVVSSALDSIFVNKKLDEKLEEVASAVEHRIINTISDRAIMNSNNEAATDLKSVLNDD